MLLGLQRRIISRFLQSEKFKLTEKQNIQEIQQCLEDGIKFCRATDRTPWKVLKFNLKHDISKRYLFESITSNNEVTEDDDHIFFHEAPNVLAEAVLTDINEQAENYGKDHAMACHKCYERRDYSVIAKDVPMNENVVVKLSHQDLADPFNVAHLRRIMYGRFVTNITKLFNKNVTLINYLHDWTDMMITQVNKRHGFLALKEGKIDLPDVFETKHKNDPCESNYQINKFMESLERGDQKALEIFQKCRNVCVGDHEKMYQRLGIKFDVTSAQSHYTEQTNEVISMTKEKNLFLVVPLTLERYIDITYKMSRFMNLRNCISNEPRDVAAIFDTFNKYSPDRLIYVSDSDNEYLDNLERIAKTLRPDQPGRIEFACFNSQAKYWKGLIATSDILDELVNSKTVIMMKHKFGEDYESLSDVSDKLRISQFAMQIFKSRRTRNFWELFNNNKMKKAFESREGAALQCTHARLCSLITLYSDDYSFKSVDFNLLSEDCAIRLVQHLARYHEVLIQSYVQLETYPLVRYLITLVKLEHLAYKELLVHNQSKIIRDTRLTLFKCTRQVLANGMNILGIQPLGKI